MNTLSDNRFDRLAIALGKKALQHLQNSSITVIGLGGVGGSAAETLVRSGIGQIRLVDIDSFQVSDLNRQVFALESTLGCKKVDVAKQRLLDINPSLKVLAEHAFFHADTAQPLLEPKPDFVIDAIDALLPKVELLSYCVLKGIPVISAMGAAMKLDWRHIQISGIQNTSYCPLARLVRRRLGRRGIRDGIMCVYSTESSLSGNAIAGESEKISTRFRGRPRPVMGSYAPVVNLFGILAADYVIKAILEKYS
jgi:tRNA threonylcarbamoyladenosine dehydratase